MPNFTAEKKHVYSLVQKIILSCIANFALHDNSEGGAFFYYYKLYKLY